MCWRARATCWWEVNLCVRFGRSPFCSGQRRGKCALRGLPSQAKLLARADQSRATSPPEPPGLTRLSTARGFKPGHAQHYYMPRRVFYRDRCNLSTCHHPLYPTTFPFISYSRQCTTASRTRVQGTNGPWNRSRRIMIGCIPTSITARFSIHAAYHTAHTPFREHKRRRDLQSFSASSMPMTTGSK